ncbi:MAG: TIGR02678 family protein [Acidimicrobiales bacterium]
MSDPHVDTERRIAARKLLERPLICAEQDRDAFVLIRRHEAELDRWFTQRLGYRLHVDTDTARLYKSGLTLHRPLRRPGRRALQQRECVLLALLLAATAAGPAVISLRDLIDAVRSAAAEAEIPTADDAAERRALVSALQWMIDYGLATELYAHVDAYATDEAADAVLQMRPDRIALLPMPALIGAADAEALLERAERRGPFRQWARAMLVELPVLYRHDVTDEEWGELRRRLGEEERLAAEMFGLVIEARAEGLAAVDPSGSLSERRFPAAGTVGHAALLVIDAAGSEQQPLPWPRYTAIIAELAGGHVRSWSNDLVEAPDRLARHVAELLVAVRLAQIIDRADGPALCLLPAAARFRIAAIPSDGTAPDQESLF